MSWGLLIREKWMTFSTQETQAAPSWAPAWLTLALRGGQRECDWCRANPPQPLASLLKAHTPLQKAIHCLTLLHDLPVSNLYLRGIMDRIFWVLIIVSSTLSHFIPMRGIIIITLNSLLCTEWIHIYYRNTVQLMLKLFTVVFILGTL